MHIRNGSLGVSFWGAAFRFWGRISAHLVKAFTLYQVQRQGMGLAMCNRGYNVGNRTMYFGVTTQRFLFARRSYTSEQTEVILAITFQLPLFRVNLCYLIAFVVFTCTYTPCTLAYIHLMKEKTYTPKPCVPHSKEFDIHKFSLSDIRLNSTLFQNMYQCHTGILPV